MSTTMLQFPSTGLQVLSACIHILGVAILTHCLSRRLATEDFSSWKSIKQIIWPRLCILLIFLDSWLFLFSSSILLFGIGLESNAVVCSSAIYLCVAFYATSKILVYFFLIEKVHHVWSPNGSKSPRFQSKLYIFCFVTVLLYMAVIVLMVIGRNHYFRDGDNSCVIGLRHYASISVLVYDFYINILLTGLFVYPLLRTKLRNPRVSRVATRTLVASGAALTTSTINMAVLTLLHGHELGWVCLGAGCGTDVIFNALALFWITRTQDTPRPNDMGPGTHHPDRAASSTGPMAIYVSSPGSDARTPATIVDPASCKGYFDVPVGGRSKSPATTPGRDSVLNEQGSIKKSESDNAAQRKFKTKWPRALGGHGKSSVDLREDGLQIHVSTITEVDQRLSEDSSKNSLRSKKEVEALDQDKP